MNERTIAGRYVLHEELGAGGMGTVYRAVDRQTDTEVAVKHLKPEMARAELIERFKREGEALRELNHPNIVKMLDAVEENDNHYLVLEYLARGDLNTLLKDEDLSLEQVLKLAIEIADALTRAHHLNIIHRDLKPSNVLLADNGTPRLTDFGVAHIGTKERVTDTNAIMGTIDYLPPEVFNNSTFDARGDIWAFGVMLYEMLSGERPFVGDSIVEVLHAITSAAIPDLEAQHPDVPIALVDLIYRMLEKDPQARIPSVRIIGAELEAILRGKDWDTSTIATQVVQHQGGRFAAATPATAPVKHNLPAQVTPFVGRESELAALTSFLTDPDIRLITILGMGGMGKTRLALETARQRTKHDTQSNRYTHGIYFVPLAPVASADHVVTAMAEALQFTFYSADNPEQQLLDYLREKSLLVVLDNFEHVIEAADFVAKILQTAPDIRLIVTSRERLNLRGETIFTIGGMEFPDWETPENALDYSGVKLFMQSARRVQPDFELVGEDVTYLARICRLVRGMPLGIELAASWVDSLRLDEIATEIARSLEFLETTMRDVPERHRSIRAVFDYSWALMADSERDGFIKLSVFRGGFTRDAAMDVTGASLRTLTTLVNKSLLTRDVSGRYQIHELVRQYAEENLRKSGQQDAMDAAHAAYYAYHCGGTFTSYEKLYDIEMINRVNVELDNVRAAWRWAVAHHDVGKLSDLVVTIHWISQVRGLYAEGVESLEAAIQACDSLEQTQAVSNALVELLLAQGWLLIRLGEVEKAKTTLERSRDLLAIADLPIGHEDPISPLALVYSIQGDYETALQIGAEAVDFNAARGDSLNLMTSYYSLTSAAFGKGDYVKAREYSQQALYHAEKHNQSWFKAYVHIDLGHIGRVMGDYAEARHHYHTSYTLRKESFDSPEGMALALKHLGQVTLLEGDSQQAKELYEKSINIYQDLGDRGGLATALVGLGRTMIALEDYDAARTHLYRALKMMADTDLIPLILSVLVGIAELLLHTQQVARAHELLGLIFAHPLCNQETRDDVEALLRAKGDKQHPAFARGKAISLDAVVADLLNNPEQSS